LVSAERNEIEYIADNNPIVLSGRSSAVSIVRDKTQLEEMGKKLRVNSQGSELKNKLKDIHKGPLFVRHIVGESVRFPRSKPWLGAWPRRRPGEDPRERAQVRSACPRLHKASGARSLVRVNLLAYPRHPC
jgi:hypothetical protein